MVWLVIFTEKNGTQSWVMTEENKIIIELHKPGKKELFFFFVSGVIVSVPIT